MVFVVLCKCEPEGGQLKGRVSRIRSAAWRAVLREGCIAMTKGRVWGNQIRPEFTMALHLVQKIPFVPKCVCVVFERIVNYLLLFLFRLDWKVWHLSGLRWVGRRTRFSGRVHVSPSSSDSSSSCSCRRSRVEDDLFERVHTVVGWWVVGWESVSVYSALNPKVVY